MFFNDIFIRSFAGPFAQQNKTLCAILVEGIIKNLFCKFILNLDHWFSRRCR